MIDEIFDLLSDKGFQDKRSGNLFFPAYIYTYDADQEYEMRENIKSLIRKLKRPNHFLDCMEINVYHELIEYLKSESFAKKSLFDLILEKEENDVDEAKDWILDEVNTGGFYDYIHNKVKSYFTENPEYRVYLIIHGFGASFPYVRASDFLKNTEKLIKDFKAIVFYPGEYIDSRYSLFNVLDDDNMYRANHLNQLLTNQV